MATPMINPARTKLQSTERVCSPSNLSVGNHQGRSNSLRDLRRFECSDKGIGPSLSTSPICLWQPTSRKRPFCNFAYDRNRPIADISGPAKLREMRAALLAMILLSGCDGADDNSSTGTVLSYRGDPDNFTSGGFPRHVYSVQNCDYEIKLKPPFEVSEDGWGNPQIRVPLGLLEDASVKDIAKGGVDAQSRVSYAFPSFYGGGGLKESFAPTAERPRPLVSAKSTLGTQETLIGDGTRGETR